MPSPRPAFRALAIPLPSLLALLALGPLGCAGGSGGGGRVYGADFPSQREVERIEKTPPPAAVFDEDLRPVPEWALRAPAPERIERRRWVEATPWGRALAEVAETSGGRVVPTQAMHCVASEFARFAIEEGGRPDLSLHRFILAGCRASVASVSFRLLEGGVEESEDDAALFERWHESLSSLLRDAVDPAGRAVVGIGFARRDGRAAVYVASGRPLVEIEPVATRLERGRPFELKGRVLGYAQTIRAAINRGRYGVAPCEPVGSPRPPAFHFACRPDPGDESAWVSLSFTPPNRVLGKRALDVLLWMGGGDDRVHRRVAYAETHPVADSAELGPAFTDELNGVRERAGLRPVTLEPAQSATATLVAPHFFAASMVTEDETLADRAALGLLAGWDVEGDIRAGSFAFGAVPGTDDLSLLLSATLEDPFARMALLDPEIDRLAVGPLLSRAGENSVLAAIVTTYALFHEEARDGEAESLFARLTRARRRRELRPPDRLIGIWMDSMNAADEVGRGANPNAALDDLLQRTSYALRREVRAWYGETSVLEDYEFPPELVSASRLGAAIGVAHRRGPHDAWGRYVVVIVSVGH